MIQSWVTLPFVCVLCFATNPLPDAPPPPTRTEPTAPTGTTKPATGDRLAELAKSDPVAFLGACRAKFQSSVKQYRATLVKRERIDGTLYPEEEIRIAVRENPYAVLFLWQRGARPAKLGGFNLGDIQGVLYAGRETKGEMIVWRPTAIFTQKGVDPTGDSARAAARFCLTEAGLGHALERTYRSWSEARDAGTATLSYVETRPVPEAGGRVCHVVRKVSKAPELDPFLMDEKAPDPATRPADAFTTVEVMVDAERGLQVGSVIRRADGELVASYYFRDVELNPSFGKDQFTPAALKK
jgi:hypothetical protein